MPPYFRRQCVVLIPQSTMSVGPSLLGAEPDPARVRWTERPKQSPNTIAARILAATAPPHAKGRGRSWRAQGRGALLVCATRDARRIRAGVQGVSRGGSGNKKQEHLRGVGQIPACCRQRRSETRRRLPDDLRGYARCHSHEHAPHSRERKPQASQGAPPQRQREAGKQRAICTG